jgi:hypothetical protein
MKNPGVSPKLIGIIFFGILLLCLSYVVFMSKSLFGRVSLPQEKIFPDGLSVLSNGELPIFRQALLIQNALSVEVSSPDRRLLIRILQVPDSKSMQGATLDIKNVYTALRREEADKLIPSLAAHYLGAHLDLQRGKTSLPTEANICGESVQILPLTENKDRYSVLTILRCADKEFFVQGTTFSREVPLLEFTEILNAVLARGQWN